MNAKSVIFDLDGTLIDSIGDIAAALNRYLVLENRPTLPLAEVQSLVGEGVNVLIDGAWRKTGTALPPDQVPAMVQRYLELYLENPAQHTIVFDGVFDLLKTLRQEGWKLGICTNKPDKITAKVLDQLGLALLVDTVVGGDFPNRKPHGDHVLETLKRLGASLEKSFYVGDSGTDVAAAKAAGIKIAVVSFGYAHSPVHQLGADWVVGSMEELLGIARALLI